jgi:hypothetical protein
LFSLLFSELKSFLKSNSIDFQEDDCGLRSDAIGLSIFSPYKEEEGEIETILVYRKGYYD